MTGFKHKGEHGFPYCPPDDQSGILDLFREPESRYMGERNFGMFNCGFLNQWVTFCIDAKLDFDLFFVPLVDGAEQAA